MKKLIYIAIALLLCSCKMRVTQHTYIYRTALINSTLCDIAYIEDNNREGKQLLTTSHESVTLADTVFWRSYCDFFAYGEDEVPPTDLIDAITLYDLSDTTSYCYTTKNHMINETAATPEEEIFLSKYSITLDRIERTTDCQTLTTHIDNELLTIFEKDYSMIEKFADYYNK